MAGQLISCQRCGAANPPHNRFCGQCGYSVQGVPPGTVPSGGGDRGGLLPAIESGPPRLPASATAAKALARLGAVGKPLAAGALVLAAEAAAIWLARRAVRGALVPPSANPLADPASEPRAAKPEGYYEEVLLVVTRGGTRSGSLIARRSGTFGRYVGGR